jgi:hypothetical protein
LSDEVKIKKWRLEFEKVRRVKSQMLQKIKKMRKELALNRKELILNDRHISPNEKALDLVANLTRDQIENLFRSTKCSRYEKILRL